MKKFTFKSEANWMLCIHLFFFGVAFLFWIVYLVGSYFAGN